MASSRSLGVLVRSCALILLAAWWVASCTTVPPSGEVGPQAAARQPLHTCRELPADVADPPLAVPEIVDVQRRPVAAGEDEAPEEAVCPGGQVPVPVDLELPKGPPRPASRAAGAPSRGPVVTANRPRGLLAPLPGAPHYAILRYLEPVAGAGMIMEVEKPRVFDAGHSLDELAVLSVKPIGATVSLDDAVEIGWHVAPAALPSDQPRLFVYHWVDNNDNHKSCYNGCGWVQVSASVFPSMELPIGRQRSVGWVLYNGNWWAWVGGQYIGYYPGSLFGGQFTQADETHWFGEVYRTDNKVPWNEMGSGRPYPTPNAARMRSPCVIATAAPAACQVTTALLAEYHYRYPMEGPPPAATDTYRYGGPN